MLERPYRYSHGLRLARRTRREHRIGDGARRHRPRLGERLERVELREVLRRENGEDARLPEAGVHLAIGDQQADAAPLNHLELPFDG